MPIAVAQLENLGTPELVALRGVEAFQSQGSEIDRILLTRDSSLAVLDFRSVHSQPECQLETALQRVQVDSESVHPDFRLPVYFYRDKCEFHEVESQEFADFAWRATL